MLDATNNDALAAGTWCWHDAYYAGRWSLLDQPAGAGAAGLAAIECNDFMLAPPQLSRLRQPLLRLLPGAPPELWRYSRDSSGLAPSPTASASWPGRSMVAGAGPPRQPLPPQDDRL